jgi:hypothetical protein
MPKQKPSTQNVIWNSSSLGRGKQLKPYTKWTSAILGLVFVFLVRLAWGSEGGGSHYLPGTYNDFSAGVFGTSGVYFRNDFFPRHGQVSRAPIGGRLYEDVDERVWTNSFKLSLVTDARIFGGRYGAALNLPVILHQRADGLLQLGPGETRQRDNRSGIGDLLVAPVQLNWRWDNHHITVAEGIFAPTGSYDSDRVTNLGRNYWAFDSTLTYTWLNEKHGHEFSLTAGYLVNTRNQNTHYRSGNELHVDALLAQHFSPRFAVGFPVYWYKQITGDDADVLNRFNLGSFRGESLGIGLAVLYKPTIVNTDVDVLLKWLHDVHARRRLEGSEIMLSISFKLWP